MAHSPLPWRVEIEGTSYLNGEAVPVHKIVDAQGNTVCDNEPWYPHAVKLADMELIVAVVNGDAG